MNAYYWPIGIAIFWLPPVFLASWLGDVKRTSSSERPWTWGLVGWVGLAVFAAKRTFAAKDPELARSRSRICLFLAALGICASVGFILYEKQHAPLNVNATVQNSTGRDVSCTKVGWMLVAGARSDVYGCIDKGDGSRVGCYAKIPGGLQDVSGEAKAIKQAGGADLACWP